MLDLHYLSFRSVIFSAMVLKCLLLFYCIHFFHFFRNFFRSFRTLSVFFNFEFSLVTFGFPFRFCNGFVFLLFFPEFCSVMFYNLQLSHYSHLKFLNFYFVVWPPWSNCFTSLFKIMAQCVVTLYLGSVTPFLWWLFCISWKALQIFSTFLFIISFLLMIIERLTFYDPAMFL